MAGLAKLFDPPAEVIADFRAAQPATIKANESAILDMLQRRPCTAQQIADVFDMHLNEVAKYLGKLTRSGDAQIRKRKNETYYVGLKIKDNGYANL